MLNWVIIIKKHFTLKYLSQTFFMQVKKIIVKPVAGIRFSSPQTKSAKRYQHMIE